MVNLGDIVMLSACSMFRSRDEEPHVSGLSSRTNTSATAGSSRIRGLLPCDSSIVTSSSEWAGEDKGETVCVPIPSQSTIFLAKASPSDVKLYLNKC